MSRIYENPNQAIYDMLVQLLAEARQTNVLLEKLIELTQKG